MKNPFEKAIYTLKLDHSIPLRDGEQIYERFITLLTISEKILNELDQESIQILSNDSRTVSYVRSGAFTKLMYALLMFRRQNGHHYRLKSLYSHLMSFYLKGINCNKPSSHTPLVNFIYDTALSEGVDLSGLSIENFVLYVEVITIKFLTPILEQIETLLHSKES